MLESYINLGWVEQIPFLKTLPLIKKILHITFNIGLGVTAVTLFLFPKGNLIISDIATEFVCASDYVEFGKQQSLVQGNLEQMLEFIVENEPNAQIHFHAYSFGSIIALDYLFPFGNVPSRNARETVEGIITIGSPYDFIRSYYSHYFEKRHLELGNRICWLNVYSTIDALASNFRTDEEAGEAHFGISSKSSKPFNINYEVS